MIEALARRWPQYAFWLATGLTDAENGHTAPPDAWTSNEDKSPEETERAAVRYFELKTLIQDTVYGMTGAAQAQDPEKTELNDDEPLRTEVATATGAHLPKSALDSTFGASVKVFKKQHSDLDYAIARIAYERRLKRLSSQFTGIVPSDGYSAAAQELIETLSSKRAVAARTFHNLGVSKTDATND
jgi:hypothetical protein